MRQQTALWGVVLVLALVGCQSPTTTALGAGETQLVIRAAAPGPRALNLASADFVTLQLTSADGRQTLFASSSGQGTGTYTLSVSGLVSGDWALKVRLYASPASSTLVYYANLTHYLAAGQSNPVTVALYQSATIDALGFTAAKPASHVGVFDLATGAWSTKGYQSLVVDRSQALRAEVLAADDTPASDQRVVWSSTDETVLEVDSQGVVTGLRPGTADLKVTTVVGKISQTFRVWVDVDLVGIWEADAETAQGAVRRVAMLDVHRSAGGLEGTLWTGLDQGTAVNGHREEVGPVFSLGHATYLSVPATFSFNNHGPDWTAPAPIPEGDALVLTVVSPDTLALEGTNQTWEFRRSPWRIDSAITPLGVGAGKAATVGQVLALGLYAPDFSPAPWGILWSTSDANVATVDGNGQVTFLAEGAVSIRAHATDGPDRVFKVNFEVRPLP